MDRLEAFETMLRELRQRAEYEKQKMDELKQGKDKTATYRRTWATACCISRCWRCTGNMG